MPRILFIFFCLILFWSPLPLGSHRVWSSALLELLIAILFMAWLLTLKKEQPLPNALSNNKTIIALFFAIPLWSALQLIPLPPEVLTWLSPHHLNYLESPTAWQSLSLDTGATLYKLQKSIAYALFFVLALALINTPNRLNQVAQLLVICGVIINLNFIVIIHNLSLSNIFECLHHLHSFCPNCSKCILLTVFIPLN